MTRKTRIPSLQNAVASGSDHDDNHGYDRPSKSQLKRDMHALQELGAALADLPKDALKRMPMPERLEAAVLEARRISAHEGKRRQIQYVGRVMRSLSDDETAALRAALDALHGVSRAATARLHWIERTRERLLADDDALTLFLREYPDANAQEARTLIRNARREAQQGKSPRHFRELFQWIKTASNTAHDNDADNEETPNNMPSDGEADA